MVDANVFIHGILKPRKNISKNNKELKKRANDLVLRINNGEPVGICVIQLSEVIRVFENLKEHEIAFRLQKFFLKSPTIKKFPVYGEDLLHAHSIVDRYMDNKISFNDAVAYSVMKREDIGEIYSFDKHFDIFDDIKRLEE
ncbi:MULTISPECIES: type II toxin-antitoxin system VapC family toxin [Methanobacterium]|jgi:predicted nucleic acid-binding protein|uniref:Type II toxin-antitoxin system VapC family toxin n=1 Tax=Methanobacterium veterum TaxID=408577 RepID=A0A9E4ZWC5_9EURY|nr:MULTISPECIES: type II toxin-antitoxin system VapC family toxin [Methanobacterium]MCZ3366391.1 type II toxin-antitoxin system VapC family toxin [Methanobacterium veterum]MCZ3371899.1 type II toxin-antitoxin system VapC family toxin [Methanobacterium veterum]